MQFESCLRFINSNLRFNLNVYTDAVATDGNGNMKRNMNKVKARKRWIKRKRRVIYIDMKSTRSQINHFWQQSKLWNCFLFTYFFYLLRIVRPVRKSNRTETSENLIQIEMECLFPVTLIRTWRQNECFVVWSYNISITCRK